MPIRQSRIQYEQSARTNLKDVSSTTIDKLNAKKTSLLDTHVYDRIHDIEDSVDAGISKYVGVLEDRLLKSINDSTVSKILSRLLGKFIPGLQKTIHTRIQSLSKDTIKDIEDWLSFRKKNPILVTGTDEIDTNDLPVVAVTTAALFSYALESGDGGSITRMMSNVPDIQGSKNPLLAIAIRNSVRENNLTNIPLAVATLPPHEIHQWLPELPSLIMDISDPKSLSVDTLHDMTQLLDTSYPNWGTQVGLSLDGAYHPNKTEDKLITAMLPPLINVSCSPHPKQLSETEILIALARDKDTLM